MREIKFRARRENGEWVVGNFVHRFATYFKTEEHYSIFLPKPQNDNGGYWVEDIDPDTIGQFTGLRDSNGVEIYEGDILLVQQGLVQFEAAVVWNEAAAAFGLVIDGTTAPHKDPIGAWLKGTTTKVIGNIHDDPNYSAAMTERD